MSVSGCWQACYSLSRVQLIDLDKDTLYTLETLWSAQVKHCTHVESELNAFHYVTVDTVRNKPQPHADSEAALAFCCIRIFAI